MPLSLKTIDDLLADNPITEVDGMRFPARNSVGDGGMTGANLLASIMATGLLRSLLKIPTWSDIGFDKGRIVVHDDQIAVSKINSNGNEPGAASDAYWEVYDDELKLFEGICSALM